MSIESAIPQPLKSSIDYAKDATVSKIVRKHKKGNVTLFAFDKGQNLSEHTSPYEAIALIIEGNCTITIDGNENKMSEGDMIIIPADVPHAVEASEAFKMLLIMIKE